MKKSVQETVNSLKEASASKEEFMRQLASLETGELSDDAKEKVSGGALPSLPIILGLIFDTAKGVGG